MISDKRPRKLKALSASGAGQTPAKPRADEPAFAFPKGSKLGQETGFQGDEPANPPRFQPRQQPKGRERSDAEKAGTRRSSRERSGVEPSLGGLTGFAMVQAICRNLRADWDDLVRAIACGWPNFRLDYRLTD